MVVVGILLLLLMISRLHCYCCCCCGPVAMVRVLLLMILRLLLLLGMMQGLLKRRERGGRQPAGLDVVVRVRRGDGCGDGTAGFVDLEGCDGDGD